MDDVNTRSEACDRFLDAAVNLLLDGEVLERRTAAGAIAALGDPDVIPILLEVLQNDPNRSVQHKVSQAIARIGGGGAGMSLQQLMRTGETYTRFLAAEALTDIVSRGTDTAL